MPTTVRPASLVISAAEDLRIDFEIVDGDDAAIDITSGFGSWSLELAPVRGTETPLEFPSGDLDLDVVAPNIVRLVALKAALDAAGMSEDRVFAGELIRTNGDATEGWCTLRVRRSTAPQDSDETGAHSIRVTREGGATIRLRVANIGPSGPANVLSIGTVTTLDAEENATASFSGAAPSQTLHLSIPRGEQGPPGDGIPGTPRGIWNSATAYVTGDIVYRAGVWYSALQASTNKDPSSQTSFWSMAATRLFPAGSITDLSVMFGAATTGIFSRYNGSLDFIANSAMDLTEAENHGPVRLTTRGSISIGTNWSTGDNRLPNQSALEIFIFNPAASAPVPMTIWQSSPDSASVEPIIFGRDRNPDRYGNTLAAALPGDSLWVIQAQPGDGLNTANIASVNIGARVQSGTTPIAGNTRGWAGNFFVAVSPGDGVTAMRTALEVQSDGDLNIVFGDVVMNNQIAITTERYGRFSALLSHLRAAIPDDTIAVIPIPGGTCGFVRGVATAVALTTPPIFVVGRFESLASLDNCMPNATLQTNVITTTGALTDFSLCTDGKITVSAHTDGCLYVCNRLGASKTYGWIFEINQNLL